MNHKRFGKTGLKLSEIGLGTYYDKPWMRKARFGWRHGASRKVEALRTGVEGGMNVIDTAEAYLSEGLVARAIRGRKREDLFIATKVWRDHMHRDDLIRALEKSLRMLEVSYVDLYQVHFPSRDVPIAETMGAMEELKEKGKIVSIGVSNFSLQEMIEANAALLSSEVVSNQVNYSLLHRGIEGDLLPYCDRNGVAVLAYYPLGHGRLADAATLPKAMEEVCKRSSKTPAQVALNWLTSKPSVFAIPRASTPGHVRENLGASDWRLSEASVRELESGFPA